MGYPPQFTGMANFQLAFDRLLRSTAKDYKHYYKHLFQAYGATLNEHLRALIDEVKRGVYTPSPPTLVFLPKKSGILRPLTLLAFQDLLLYQAILNVIASQMEAEQTK